MDLLKWENALLAKKTQSMKKVSISWKSTNFLSLSCQLFLFQVRIGMDLTKIVLPTFILERRSLLEMYSDFFAHPDIFLSIPDGKDPEERMVRVLRWYGIRFNPVRVSFVLYGKSTIMWISGLFRVKLHRQTSIVFEIVLLLRWDSFLER